MINIAVLGYGTVGSGVYEVFRTNRDMIASRTGEEIRVKYVLDLREFPGDPVEEVLTHDFQRILKDPEVKVVAEVMGGTGAAYTFTKECLLAGKHVCTSNKALVAAHGRELVQLAGDKGVNYLFEASCGGGIPIIRAINEALTADVLLEVTGILNGTTNYMLYKMETEGADFGQVLKEAQAMGYAEADPTADIEGHDACRKIAILSTLAYGKYLDYTQVHTEGITAITSVDMGYAALLGRKIRLLGTSRIYGDSCAVMVAPFLVASDNPLYGVNDVFNAVFVHGNMLGPAMFYGSGAGKLPTASAVASDILACASHLEGTLPTNWSSEPIRLLPFEEITGQFFVRVKKEAEGLAEELFGKTEHLQLENHPEEFGLVTAMMKEQTFAVMKERLGDAYIGSIRCKES